MITMWGGMRSVQYRTDASKSSGSLPSLAALYETEPSSHGLACVVSLVQGADAREIQKRSRPKWVQTQMSHSQASVHNRLLRAMSAEDFALISPHLLLRPGTARAVLIAPYTAIDFLYFPERGFTSVTLDGNAGPVEVGMIGREGLVGAVPVMLGIDRTPHQPFVQMPGDNLRIPAADFQDVLAQSPTMRALLLRYVQTVVVQIAQTAWANATCDIEVRLARWILMCHDRAEAQDIHITHEFIVDDARRPASRASRWRSRCWRARASSRPIEA